MLSRQYVIYYVCINSRDKFNEKLLLSKESFYSDLNIKICIVLLMCCYRLVFLRSIEKKKYSQKIWSSSCKIYYTSITLEKTEIELEFLTDIDMIHGYKIRIRGVINKYINIFDSPKSSSFIMYLHFDNQY